MEITSSDLIITLIAIGVSVTVVYLFVKASGGLGNKETKTELDKPIAEPIKAENVQPQQELKEVEESLAKRLEHFPRHLTPNEVEKVKSDLKILTLKKELLGAVIKRLFEAEDAGEISKDERIRLSKDYEDEMKKISEDLKKAELIITLNELETLREEIVKRYESTLNKTQSRIDSILKELKLEEHKPEALPKRKLIKKEAETGEEKPEKEEVIEEAAAAPKKAKSDVEERLEQLRKDVLKELEELEKLEIES
ncbi:hypothetical protein KEJ21_03375 [Candidatus Bathyarchaeota archaeon]|nr:hypothetical protein [Candidatus Bathyarchaeota archaeon]MBS7630275.1 hypothetical protein [Candidatus Bathyarchaeota archaeon]